MKKLHSIDLFSSGFIESKRDKEMSHFPPAGQQAAAGLDMKSPDRMRQDETG